MQGSMSDQQFKEREFKNSEHDNRIYFYVTSSEFVMRAVVVDDSAFSSNSSSLLLGFKSRLGTTSDIESFVNYPTSLVGT